MEWVLSTQKSCLSLGKFILKDSNGPKYPNISWWTKEGRGESFSSLFWIFYSAHLDPVCDKFQFVNWFVPIPSHGTTVDPQLLTGQLAGQEALPDKGLGSCPSCPMTKTALRLSVPWIPCNVLLTKNYFPIIGRQYFLKKFPLAFLLAAIIRNFSLIWTVSPSVIL